MEARHSQGVAGAPRERDRPRRAATDAPRPLGGRARVPGQLPAPAAAPSVPGASPSPWLPPLAAHSPPEPGVPRLDA
jgi:hypothetical protein